jgi:signal peptidase I
MTGVCLAIWSVLIPKCDILVTAGIYLALGAIGIWNLFDAHKCARKTNPGDFETERKQTKDPWLALFLSDLIPGLGQIYVKKWVCGIVFLMALVLLLVIGAEYRLLWYGLWPFLSAFVCYHAYVWAPTRRERSGKTISIIAALILCSYLLDGVLRYAFKAYVVEAFQISVNALLPPMKPTLDRGDRVLVRKSSKYIPKRGDVVAFESPEDPGSPWIMRVTGLSGETVEVKDKILYVDGQKVKCPALEKIDYIPDHFGVEAPYEVPASHILVVGDNTANSEDSRFFGAIPQSDVIGKAYKIYWPLSRRGPIE